MTVNAVAPVSDHTCPIIPEEDTLQYLAAHRILRIMVTGAFAIFGCYRLVNTTPRPPKTRPEIASGDGPPNYPMNRTRGRYRGPAASRLGQIRKRGGIPAADASSGGASSRQPGCRVKVARLGPRAGYWKLVRRRGRVTLFQSESRFPAAVAAVRRRASRGALPRQSS